VVQDCQAFGSTPDAILHSSTNPSIRVAVEVKWTVNPGHISKYKIQCFSHCWAIGATHCILLLAINSEGVDASNCTVNAHYMTVGTEWIQGAKAVVEVIHAMAREKVPQVCRVMC
jgi:hypothetical protein